MIPTIGRLLQIAGLIILPIGFSYGMFHDNVQMEVRLLFIGGTVFVVGWLLSRKR
ncbi:MAG TPA: hypothetical protein VJZ76_12440 [Thermoanaerobaculia bacterium]|nr:hypothetical protein [Thermoanaerobaculia bacterium]